MSRQWKKKVVTLSMLWALANLSFATTLSSTPFSTKKTTTIKNPLFENIASGSHTPFTTKETTTIKSHLFENIASDDHIIIKDGDGSSMRALSGAVVASPSHYSLAFSQDYEFHWVRDSALTMQTVILLYSEASSAEKARLRPYLLNYVQFEKRLQQQSSPSTAILGEPKFNIDSSLFQGPWGRPQNDGPALRAIAISTIASLFLEEGSETYVRDTLLPMITDDLDYVRDHWRDSNFDIWEEVYDQDHFFNKMVQRKALLQGASLVKFFGDTHRADTYKDTATALAESLEGHWNAARGYFSETINQQSYKGGGLNSAIILGVLYGNTGTPNDAFAVNNDRVMSTVYFIRNAFAGLYKVNVQHPHRPPLIGRYPNDIYDGDKFLYGNPWFLTTNALAEYYYTLAGALLNERRINITDNNQFFYRQVDKKLFDQIEEVSLSNNPGRFYAMIAALVNEGDQLLEIVKGYSVCYDPYNCLHLSEQIDRSSGKQVSAGDLTWSYATLLTAMHAREQVAFLKARRV